MQLRAHAELDFELAWARVLTWARGGTIDLPDRLPFEVLHRLDEKGPQPVAVHHLSPVEIVMSSKKSGTSRPFARLDAIDLTVYQALVDKLAPDLEAALPSRDCVFAYRQTLDADEHAFAGTPSRAEFEARIQSMFNPGDGIVVAQNPWRFAITTDIAGYFLHVGTRELERVLYEVSGASNAIRDLVDLLEGWQRLGIRGLPQGIRPSAPLGNIYLRPIDQLLRTAGIPYVRWMDDWVIAAQSFHAAREIQDEIERSLYAIGLTLAGDKTRVVRALTAVEESEGAKQRLSRMKRARREAVQEAFEEVLEELRLNSDYPEEDPDLPDLGELDLAVILEQYEPLLDALDREDLPKGFRPTIVEILRDLGSLKHTHGVDRLPRLVERAPDLTGAVTKYLTAICRAAPVDAIQAFDALLAADRFSREYEKLDLCAGVLALPLRGAPGLAPPLAGWALHDEHVLVRARAVLAWGAQSAETDFTVADAFWSTAASRWREYALVAIQSKDVGERDERYDRWSGEGRHLGRLAAALKVSPLAWRKI